MEGEGRVRELRAHAITFFRFHVFEGGSSREELPSLFIIVKNWNRVCECVFTIVRFVFESFEILKEERDEMTSDKEEKIRVNIWTLFPPRLNSKLQNNSIKYHINTVENRVYF